MTDNDKPTVGRITQLSDKPVPPDIKGGELVRGDHDVLMRALHAAEARCAQLHADLAETRDERDGFSKTCTEQRTEIATLTAELEALRAGRDGLKEYADNLRDQRDYYADRVEEARDVIEGMLPHMAALTKPELDSMIAAAERGRAFLDKPAAWARDDKESEK